ncbi:MAG: AMP-binding protein [Pseudomonadota bacterium]
MTDLFTPIERNAAFDPDHIALRFGEDTITYRALVEKVHGTVELLRAAGVAPGERIALLSLNHPGFLVLLYAAARLGAILVPLNWRLAHDELAYAIAHAEPLLLFHDEAFADGAAQLMPQARLRAIAAVMSPDQAEPVHTSTDPSAPCLMVYTSGTTGRPKGALLSSRALLDNAVNAQHMHQMRADDHALTFLPMFHVGGLNIQPTPLLMAGGTVSVLDRFDPAETLTAVSQLRPTLMVVVPAVMSALMAEKGFATADFSSLRAVATGSTIIPETLLSAFKDRGIPVICVYGATETCPIAAYERVGVDRHVGGTGRVALLNRVKISGPSGETVPVGTDGEIAVADVIFSGYFRDEEATNAALRDGYFHTGDVGRLTKDGALIVHDRLKNLIISGGENIYPAEVERVLSQHPAVLECAVVGKPDERWQEVPVAFVVRCEAVAPEALVAHMSHLLARYKVPRDVRFIDALPRTALGKVRHDVLRQRAHAA